MKCLPLWLKNRLRRTDDDKKKKTIFKPEGTEHSEAAGLLLETLRRSR